MNIGLISLGCSKNQVDSELILGMISKKGYNIVIDENLADIIIVNTCGFIESAKKESISTLLEMSKLKENGVCKAVIAVGCLAQRYKNDIIEQIPEIDEVVSLKDYELLGSIIDKYAQNEATNASNVLNHNDRILTTPYYTAYIKVSEGCNNRCTYCVIPSIRGSYVSRPVESIIEEAKVLAAKGVEEIILIAQDTTSYGKDLYGESKLDTILKEIANIPSIKWVRFLYAYPEILTDRILETVVSLPKACKYFDIPIQHASDNILKLMARRSRQEQIRELIKKIRNKMPDAVIRTTVIVGFPGETEKDFNILKDFIKEAKFDRLGAFEYSKEEGTPAAKMLQQVPAKIKKQRYKEVMELQKDISFNRNKEFIGKQMEVLIEATTDQDNIYLGRTYRDAPDIDGFVTVVSEEVLNPGDFVTVEITSCTEYDLSGIYPSQS